MNRNPKFRIWDLLDQKMKYFTFDDLIEGDCPVHPSCGDWEGVMHGSGLLDMNGKEIYDCDILELINEDLERILVVCRFGVARRKMDSGRICDIRSFYFQTTDGFQSFPIVNNYDNKHDLDIMEIVGNIYEQPHLYFNIA